MFPHRHVNVPPELHHNEHPKDLPGTWALVLSSSKTSLVQSRRAMKDALLTFERHGAVVAERPMGPFSDIALSATHCIACVSLAEVEVSPQFSSIALPGRLQTYVILVTEQGIHFLAYAQLH